MVVYTLVIGMADGSHGLLIGCLADEISGVLILPGALRIGNVAVLKHINPLPAVDGVFICRSQGIGDVLLTSQPVAAIFRLTVNGVARNANAFLQDSDTALIFAGVGVGRINVSGDIGFPTALVGFGRFHAVGFFGIKRKSDRTSYKRNIVSPCAVG